MTTKLTTTIRDEEVSSDPATGWIAGDADPSATQDAVLTKLRDQQAEIKTALEAVDDDFDAAGHDHSGAAKGTPIGTNGGNCFVDGAIDNSGVIAANAVTAAKIAAGAVTEDKLASASVTLAKIGSPSVSSPITIAAGGTTTFTPSGVTRGFMFHIEGDADYAAVQINPATAPQTLSITNVDPINSITITVVYLS